MCNVGVFFEKVDSTGHAVGPNGDTLKEVIRKVDAELLRLQTILETTRLDGQTTGSMSDHVNLVIFSDHGMKRKRIGGANDNTSALIRILDYVNRTDFDRSMGSSSGPVQQIWPHKGQENEVIQILQINNCF